MAKKNTPHRNGLILGKFYPPHNGHRYLIERAADKCEKLTILVCSLVSEKIPGKLRYRWISELYPQHRVIHVTDENPSYPEQHSDFWNIWKTTILKAAPEKPDVIFTSETYGDRLAEELLCSHELIDLHRSTITVSATQIRNAPLQHWEQIPELIRPYFVKKIVLTGPESCGKTTLASQLAAHFSTVWASEYAREYLNTLGRYVIESDIPEIMKGHIKQEEYLTKEANKILFLDTDLTVTKIYARHYFNNIPKELKEAEDSHSYDHYLLLKPDIPWVADWQRDAPHLRNEFFSVFENEIKLKNTPYTIIEGDYNERLQKAILASEKVMAYPMRNV